MLSLSYGTNTKLHSMHVGIHSGGNALMEEQWLVKLTCALQTGSYIAGALFQNADIKITF